ncbi:unnamed protein product, partial [Closterium sp. NIES-54]
SSCEAEIYAGAMAAQELRWLTYLLTDLGEVPRSPPILYVDNKAMLALCQEHRLEHRTKHIALRYFLARELQQRGQLRLAYVASQANAADFFTKALQPFDHQRFCTVVEDAVKTGAALESRPLAVGQLVDNEPDSKPIKLHQRGDTAEDDLEHVRVKRLLHQGKGDKQPAEADLGDIGRQQFLQLGRGLSFSGQLCIPSAFDQH